MKKKPLVSILIPAYNAERYILDTIYSAISQTWSRREIIIVDDGSSDRTHEIARAFEGRDVKVLTQPNAGAAAARNRAYAECQGDVVQWLDADDLLDPDKISRQMQVRERSPGGSTLFSSAWGHFFHRTSRTRFVPTSLWCDLSPVDWVLRYLQQGCWMQTSTWLVSRELSEVAGPWDCRLLGDDDGEYFCRVVLASDAVLFVPEARVHYRRTPNSLSHIGMSRKKLDAQFLSLELQCGHLLAKEDSERAKAACLHCLQNFFILFYPEMPTIVERAQELAESLGGHLERPCLSRKYAWIQKLFGWPAAKQSQMCYNQLKSSVLRSWDYALFRVEKRNAGWRSGSPLRDHWPLP